MAQSGQDFPDCTVCRRKGQRVQRERWGCDKTSIKLASWWMACDCSGQNEECPRCKGRGSIPMKRCPNSILESAPQADVRAIFAALQLYSQYDARHILPAAGGWLDQSPTFLEFVSLVDGERGRWDRLREEALAKDRKKSG